MSKELRQFKSRALARPEVKREYDRLAEEFEFLDEILKARGATFTGSLTAAGSAAVDITTTHSGDLGAKGVVCGALIAGTITTAADNFGAALSAAGSVAASLSVK